MAAKYYDDMGYLGIMSVIKNQHHGKVYKCFVVIAK